MTNTPRRNTPVPSRIADKTADWPLFWFARLEAALDRGDTPTATQALRRLEHLGIEVRYLLPRCPRASSRPRNVESLLEGEVDGAH
jgi:hypothetical protein